MKHFLAKLLPIPLYPVGLALLLAVAAIVLLVVNRRRLALVLISISVFLLYIFSTSAVSFVLVRGLEARYDPVATCVPSSAILLLGGAGVAPAPPRLYPETNHFGDRIMHAARLWHSGCAPVIVTSGERHPFSGKRGWTEAEVNRALLVELLGVDSSAIVLEQRSVNTRDHARYIAEILEERQVPYRVTVVTSAVHMYRAVRVLEKAGFTAYPSPTDYKANSSFPPGLPAFLPNANSLNESTMAIHEYYGLVAYRVLGWI